MRDDEDHPLSEERDAGDAGLSRRRLVQALGLGTVAAAAASGAAFAQQQPGMGPVAPPGRSSSSPRSVKTSASTVRALT